MKTLMKVAQKESRKAALKHIAKQTGKGAATGFGSSALGIAARMPKDIARGYKEDPLSMLKAHAEGSSIGGLGGGLIGAGKGIYDVYKGKHKEVKK